jgi:hypothetical protein
VRELLRSDYHYSRARTGMKTKKKLLIRSLVMTIDRLVLAFAGSFILISLLLSVIHSHYWLWFTAFVGANLVQASFTGFCPLAKILKALGFKPGEAFS